MKAQATSALPTIVRLYDSADPSGRSDVLEAVTAIDATGEHALPILLKAVQDPEVKDRRDALIGLMRFRSRVDAIIGPVTEVLKDSEPENRLLAVGIIRGLGQQGLSALPSLIAASRDPDPRVRSAALNALVSYRPLPQEVFDALENSLKDGDSRIRSAAVNSLRTVGQDYPERTTTMLKAALEAEKNGASKKLIESVLQSVVKGKDAKPGDQSDSQKIPAELSSKK
jgi:HEAT repeat protein